MVAGNREPTPLQTARRLRIVFRKDAEIKYISHLDLMRCWERALRRANVNLSYSHGFNPRPKLVFASALPVGSTGRAEMVDITLDQRVDLRGFAFRLNAQLPAGLHLVRATEVPSALPSLPGQVVAAEYEVLVESKDSTDAMQSRLNCLLAAETVRRHRERPDGNRVYDLRPLIKKLWIVGRRAEMHVIGMHLQADAQGTGRPDEVMAALGMTEAVRGIERVRLLFSSA
jgi:radical SAM-linked protein